MENDIKRIELIRKGIVINANKTLRKLTELKNIPKESNSFLKILSDTFVELKGIERVKREHIIGLYCVMTPEELIYAAGAVPVKLCSGVFRGAYVGDDITPRDACPLVKSCIGLSSMDLLPIYSETSMYIVPISCECKRKMAYDLAKFKPVVPLHIPASRHDEECYIDNFVNDLFLLKNTLEHVTKQKITLPRLRKSIKDIASMQKEVFRLLNIQKSNPSVIQGSLVMAILNSYSFCRAEKFQEALFKLNNELEEKIKQNNYIGKKNSPRIIITGAPIMFPNLKIPMLIEESGGIVVADETCMSSRRLYDPVAVVDNSMEGLMRALAVRYILPSTCPTFVQNEQRLFKLKQMVTEYKADGVIYHVLRGCQVYDFEYKRVEEEIAKLNIPIIRVETDYNEEDIEQLRIRLEAFIETIKYKDAEL